VGPSPLAMKKPLKLTAVPRGQSNAAAPDGGTTVASAIAAVGMLLAQPPNAAAKRPAGVTASGKAAGGGVSGRSKADAAISTTERTAAPAPEDKKGAAAHTQPAMDLVVLDDADERDGCDGGRSHALQQVAAVAGRPQRARRAVSQVGLALRLLPQLPIIKQCIKCRA
jgi:hypothetical protein